MNHMNPYTYVQEMWPKETENIALSCGQNAFQYLEPFKRGSRL